MRHLRLSAFVAIIIVLTGILDLGVTVRAQSVPPNVAFAALYRSPVSLGVVRGHGGLMQGSDGRLYGTTWSYGENGTVFAVDVSGAFTTLHSGNGPDDPFGPTGSLIQASNGLLYGTSCDMNGTGTVFRMDANGGAFTTMHTFFPDCPFDGVIEAGNGFFYGTLGDGSVFRMDADGAVTTLRSSDGTHPASGLIQASNGFLYGVTVDGGAGGVGSIFRMDVNGGAFATLHAFGPAVGFDSVSPNGVIEASDGYFYGTDQRGGESSCGTIFRMSATGDTFETLYQFAMTDGAYPVGRLLQASDGSLYGVTYEGGWQRGTIFRYADGALTTLHTFGWPVQDGLWYPEIGLAQASSGVLYGMTQVAIFKLVVPSCLRASQAALATTISGLRSNLTTANQTIASLQGDLATANSTIAGLTSQLATANQTVAGLQAQANSLSARLDAVETDFRSEFNDPSFTIPGLTVGDRYQNLVQAILALSKGQKGGIYRGLVPK